MLPKIWGAIQARFIEAMLELLRFIATLAYAAAPPALFLVCGPMTFAYCDAMQHVATAARAEGLRARAVKLRRLRGSWVNLCCSHPSAREAALLVPEFVAFVRAVMGWEMRSDRHRPAQDVLTSRGVGSKFSCTLSNCPFMELLPPGNETTHAGVSARGK